MCVFYGHTLRLINIDSELSLLAESQVVFDGADRTEIKRKNKKSACARLHTAPILYFSFFSYS